MVSAAVARARLASPAPPVRSFEPRTIDTLPAPAQRLLRQAVPDGHPLATTVLLEMRGDIKLGSRWSPFTATQVLRAGAGFVWEARVGGRLVWFEGADVLAGDDAGLDFRLWRRLPVARGSGPDVHRSAQGRSAAETVAWVPTALTPQAGAVWDPIDERTATVTLAVQGESVQVDVAVAEDGTLEELVLKRWRDSADPPAYDLFGGRMTDELVTASGVRIAAAGAVGWGWGTDAWRDGEFFRFHVTSAELR